MDPNQVIATEEERQKWNEFLSEIAERISVSEECYMDLGK